MCILLTFFWPSKKKTPTLSFLIADAEGIGDSQGKFWVINKRHSGNKGHCELFGYYQLLTQCKSIADTVSKSPKY